MYITVPGTHRQHLARVISTACGVGFMYNETNVPQFLLVLAHQHHSEID